MKTSFLLACASAGLFLASAHPLRAQGIFDDFLVDNQGMPQENMPGFPTEPNGFRLWTVSNGSVDLVGSSILNPPGDLFGRYVDLGGSTNDAALFAYAMPVSLLADTSYTLSFFYNSVDGAANSASVNFGGQIFTVSSSTTAFSTFSQEFTFTTAIQYPGALSDPDPQNSPLQFQDLGNDVAGIGIDRIMVSPTAVPEPATLSLFAASLAAFAFWRRKQITPLD